MKKPRYNLAEKREFAAQMRANPTPAEAALWSRICRKQTGYRFQRQIMLYGYIVDFVCPTARLAIEVDGSVHDIEDLAARDEEKDAVLEKAGYGILRFTNDEVLNSLRMVLDNIRRECDYRMQHQTPLRGVGFDFRSSLGKTKSHPVVAEEQFVEVDKSPMTTALNGLKKNAIRKSQGKTEEIPPEQWITRQDAEEAVAKFSKILRTTRADGGVPPQTMQERALDAKLRLAEYIARRSKECNQSRDRASELGVEKSAGDSGPEQRSSLPLGRRMETEQ